MANSFDTPELGVVDFDAIERRARELRAQTAREGVLTIKNWFVGLFAGKSVGAVKAA